MYFNVFEPAPADQHAYHRDHAEGPVQECLPKAARTRSLHAMRCSFVSQSVAFRLWGKP